MTKITSRGGPALNAQKPNVVKNPEKSGLEPTAPNRPADRKHCALSTQPNPHLLDGDLAESIKRGASDRLGDLVP